MQGSLWRVAGCVALLTMLLPHAWSVTVALHLAGHDHDTRQGIPLGAAATGLALAWHGHGHDAQDPEHDHPLLSANAAAACARPAFHRAHATALVAGCDNAKRWRSLASGRPALAVGVGPPADPRSYIVLRV